MHLPELSAEAVALHPDAGGWRVESDGAPAGRVDVTVAEATAVVAVAIDERQRDRGIGTAALRAAAAWLLSSGGCARLEHRVPFGEWAPLRVAEKAGFRYEGLLRGAGRDGADLWLSARLASDDGAERASLLPQPWLHGGSVTLRPYEPADAQDVSDGGNDPLTQRWMSTMPSPYTLDDARWWITRGSVEHRASGEGVNFAIAENSSGRFVGGIGLHHRDRVRHTAEVGYWLAPWGRGKGYAAEATRVACRWAFSALGLQRVNLMAAVGNEPSQRVAERAGFTRVGVARAATVARDGSPVDMVLFELVADGLAAAQPHQKDAAIST